MGWLVKPSPASRTPPAEPPRRPAANPWNPKKKSASFARVLGVRRAEPGRAGGSPDGPGVSERCDAPRPGLSLDRVPPDDSRADPPRPDPVDPWTRVLARPVLGPEAARPSAPPVPPPSVALELALDKLVRRLSWGGNGRRGSARVELGAGALAGSTVVVHVDDGEVSLEIEASNGVEDAEWRARLVSRLERRGLVVIP
jgi:hypothetical protein